MEWYHYAMCFFGGAFIANFLPHYVRGIAGAKFPTPFAKPPGRGLSPAPLNVVWALVNLVAGFLLLRSGGFPVGARALHRIRRIRRHEPHYEQRVLAANAGLTF